MSNKVIVAAVGALTIGALAPVFAMAQNAEAGKVYEVTVAAEVESPFVGQFGDARIGETAVQIPGAKKGEKYSVTVKEIKQNPFTGLQQAACTFKQIGDEREGNCNSPPG